MVESPPGRSYFKKSDPDHEGAEEERHADLWRNAMLFLKARAPAWIRAYAEGLSDEKRWDLPWDDVLHLTCYVLIQERATQLNYLNTVLIATGKSDNPELANDVDPVLAHAANTIAIDEAAMSPDALERLKRNRGSSLMSPELARYQGKMAGYPTVQISVALLAISPKQLRALLAEKVHYAKAEAS